MERQSRHRRTQIEDGVFVALVVLVSIAFALVVEPFFGAILWGVIVAILFILFDLEIAFLLPWAVALRDVGGAGFAAVLIFLTVLVVGFVYEWKKGALDWD